VTTFDEIRAAAAAPRELVARVLLRHDLSELHAERDAELQALIAERGDEIGNPEVRAKAAEVLALEAEIDESLVAFRFRALSARDWRVLMAAHPPTKQQKTANEQATLNEDSFWPAAVAACLVDPALTPEQVLELEASVLTSDQWDALKATCLTVNRAGDTAGKSWAAGLIHRTSGASVRRPTTTESPSPSSSDE
jgi:hypothetical protein